MSQNDKSDEFLSGCVAAMIAWTVAGAVVLIVLALSFGAAYRLFRWVAGI